MEYICFLGSPYSNLNKYHAQLAYLLMIIKNKKENYKLKL